MPQDAFAAYANGLNAAIAYGYDFTGTSRAAEPQAAPQRTGVTVRRQMTKSAPTTPKRPVISHFEDLHAKSSAMRLKEARALRAELALLPEVNIDTETFKSRRSSKSATESGVLTVAEEGDSSYEFSDIDAARALSRSRKGLRSRVSDLSGAQSALNNDLEELRQLQRESEANYKKLRLLQQSLLIEAHDLKRKQETLEHENMVLESKLKGTQAVSLKLSSTHHRLQHNVDILQRHGSMSPDLLKRVGGGSLVSSVRRKKRLQQSFERPISTLQDIALQLDEQSQSSEKTIRRLSARIELEEIDQQDWGPFSKSVAQTPQPSSPTSLSADDLVAVAALKSQLESSVKREETVRRQLQSLRNQLSLARRAASESAADANAELKYLKSSRRPQVRVSRIASSTA